MEIVSQHRLGLYGVTSLIGRLLQCIGNPVNRLSAKFMFPALLLLGACDAEPNANIEVSGLNYTDTDISIFSVNGYAGHGIYPGDGGGKFVCCIAVPRQWREGMRVTVGWTADDRRQDAWKERIVEVPRYAKNEIGAFVVHFYPGDVVKVLVTDKIVGHPEYPYPRPKKP